MKVREVIALVEVDGRGSSARAAITGSINTPRSRAW